MMARRAQIDETAIGGTTTKAIQMERSAADRNDVPAKIAGARRVDSLLLAE